ncbi:TonB-dependent receptor [Sulfurospirillum sp. 1612]|uniref:TonB-dependent receptor n=1 Tax=Sulfurospirillum sp. 1612 TaxID=3094835 RepID=UPI002F93C1C3
MNKKVCISVMCALCINAYATDLGKIEVTDFKTSKVVEHVNQEEVKSADLAESLSRVVPSISLQRRSGIANDIILRGQRKDDINVLIDDGKIYGACPNRMDPPTSHVLTNNIEKVEVIEGPYDVTNFGTLSGVVKVTTSKPTKETHGDVNLNVGSWGYKKASASVSGGTDKVRVLIGASTEQGGQYKDGNGNTLAEQLKLATDGTSDAPKQYKPSEFDRDAYKKTSFMGKLYIDVTENQELQLGYTGNRSDNILYPSTPMDAISDDSDLYNVKYIIKNLNQYSDRLNFEYYYSTVDHPMTTQYRKASDTAMGTMANVMSSTIYGGKISNDFHIDDAKISYGIDASKRNWDGRYWKNYTSATPIPSFKSIPDVDTTNVALFTKGKKSYGKYDLEGGLRYDHTKIEAGNSDPSKTYDDLSGYILAYYNQSDALKYFAGIGKSIRVPDGKESHDRDKSNALIGNPNLNETKNYEADLGFEVHQDNAAVKVKLFYSILKDFIIFNKSDNQYQNVDATLYGAELSGTYFATDSIYFDFGVAYQRGEKDEPLANQTNTNLPSIPPIKANIGINYDYDPTLSFKAEIVASGKWSDYDADNGEQEIDSWSIVNLKASKDFYKRFNITVGINNIFDKAYAISNTYSDLTLVSGTASNVMLLNEPGRYYYMNLKYKF